MPAAAPHPPAVKKYLGWAVLAVTAVFVFFNMDRAQIWFFGIDAQMPIAFVVIASALLGALATYAFMSLRTKK